MAAEADKLDQQDQNIAQVLNVDEEEAKISKVAKRIHRGYFPSSQSK